VLVVTPNTCTDITSWVPTLAPGTVARAPRTVVTAGGKGVNVARVLRRLGHETTLVGLASQSDDRLIRLLREEGCTFRSIRHPGPGRIAQIFLEDSGRATVVNGAGPAMTPRLWDDLLATVAAELDTTLAGERGPVACSGSLPPGAPQDGYGQIVDLAHERGLLALVDAGPAVLGATLDHAPDLVSPNLAEAEGLLLGRADESVDESGLDVPDRCLAASRALHERGARRAVVTGGGSGAALTTDDGSRWFQALPVTVRSPIGAGDSFVGGWAHALTAGASDDEAMPFAVAVAAASCETESAGEIDPERLRALLADPGMPAADAAAEATS
jgi:1-phosphofructokinase family hexose kinase